MGRLIFSFITLLLFVVEILDFIGRFTFYKSILDKKVSFSTKQIFDEPRAAWWQKETERAEIRFLSDFTLDFSRRATQKSDPVPTEFHFLVNIWELRDRQQNEMVPWSEQLSCYFLNTYCNSTVVVVKNYQISHEWQNSNSPILLSLEELKILMLKAAQQKSKPLGQDLSRTVMASSTLALETIISVIREKKQIYFDRFKDANDKNEQPNQQGNHKDSQPIQEQIKIKRDPNLILSHLALSANGNVQFYDQSNVTQNTTHYLRLR